MKIDGVEISEGRISTISITSPTFANTIYKQTIVWNPVPFELKIYPFTIEQLRKLPEIDE